MSIKRLLAVLSILALSPGIYPLWPMINYLDGRMTMRFLTMWVLQGVYATCDDFPALYNPPDTMGESEKYFFDAVSDDFAREHPDLLIGARLAVLQNLHRLDDHLGILHQVVAGGLEIGLADAAVDHLAQLVQRHAQRALGAVHLGGVQHDQARPAGIEVARRRPDKAVGPRFAAFRLQIRGAALGAIR